MLVTWAEDQICQAQLHRMDEAMLPASQLLKLVLAETLPPAWQALGKYLKTLAQ